MPDVSKPTHFGVLIGFRNRLLISSSLFWQQIGLLSKQLDRE